MRQVSNSDIRTFTVGFPEAEYNEAASAQAVARHLGTNHTQMITTFDEARANLARIHEYFDEPFADSSQIPTYLLSKLTREHVTVALSGDGGDELFCGYDKYALMAKWQYAWRVPHVLRNFLARCGSNSGNDRVRLATTGLSLRSPLAFSDYYASIWKPQEISTLVLKAYHDGLSADNDAAIAPGMKLLEQMMLTDLQRYLPNDILTKVDRASMAVSLEARVPLLDHRLVQFAMKLPLSLKWRNGTSKYLVRQVLHRYVPRQLMDRPKHGFSVPLDDWLRRDLHGLIAQYLDADRLKRQGVFDPVVVRHHVNRFETGHSIHGRVWSLLAFQMWAERYWPAA
jgi:asparagine synthase (glutamine-hydrolysing)